MGYICEYKPNNKWQVQIRHRGFKSFSATFSTYELAKEYNDKVEAAIRKKKELELIDKAIEKIQAL